MSVKVSPKYQVVIPEEVRKSAGIKPGMQVSVLHKGGIIYIVPIKSIEEIADSLAKKFSSSDLKNIREKKDRKI